MREGSGSSARTPMMMASPRASTRTTVRADGVAPRTGSTWVRFVIESASAHAGSSKRPSTLISPWEEPTRSVGPTGCCVDANPAALDNTAAANTAARGNVGLTVTASLAPFVMGSRCGGTRESTGGSDQNLIGYNLS